MHRSHRDRQYEERLRRLREKMLIMAGRVEQMIARSVRALVERDSELAAATIADDKLVNQAELAADEQCLAILATRQPVASDLRFITLCLKAVTDIERIGDLAVHISERALVLNREPPLKPYTDLPRMAGLVQVMVRHAMDAFVAGDVALARQVLALDDEVDELNSRIYHELVAVMRSDGDKVERGIHVQSVAKWLERMGDHATNIAEQVIFMVEGKDIRHLAVGRDGVG
jgi:phosphate transport system protein